MFSERQRLTGLGLTLNFHNQKLNRGKGYEQGKKKWKGYEQGKKNLIDFFKSIYSFIRLLLVFKNIIKNCFITTQI
jgi:hypothetical protein